MKVFSFVTAALFSAGMVYADSAELEKAKQQGAKALIQYGQKLEKAKKYNDAICAYQAIVSSDKNVANVQEALIKSAKAKVKLNDFGGAINDYEKVLKLKDDNQKKTLSNYVTAIQDLSTIYSNRLNDFPGAIALVEKAEKTPNLHANEKNRLKAKRGALLSGQVSALIHAKKFDDARKLAAANLKNMPGATSAGSCINVEIAYSKTLTSKKKYAEADKVLRAANQFKGAKPGSYYAIQEAIMMNMLSKRDQAAAKKELEILKQMPGPKNGKILAEVRYLTSFNMNKEAIDLLVKSAEDTSFSKNVRAGFYGSAAFFAVSRLHNIKLCESYYAKAKELMGPKYKNTQVENSLNYWRRKL
jgi:tetratricopeptide (TPR) repeat protein